MRTPSLLLVLAVLPAYAEAPSVVIPLDRYEALTAQQKGGRSYTVVESAHLEGSLEKGPTLVLKGRAAGDMPAVAVLASSELRLSDCGDEALLSRGSRGEVLLTPFKPRFTLRCSLGTPRGDALSVAVLGVLDVQGALADGTVEVSEGADGARTLVATRAAAKDEVPREALAPTAVGRFRVSILPASTQFLWLVSVHNPNRARASFTLKVRPGEAVEQVTAAAPYVPSEAGLTFQVPPGDVELTVTGTTTNADFIAPFEGAVHYLLVESHPLLRATVDSAAQRLSPSQVGLASQYRGSQALLMTPGQRAGWTVAPLPVLPTTSYTVSSLKSLFFIGADGRVVGQSDIDLANQGASEISLPLGAVPAFASVQGAPTQLTTDGRGALWLPLAQGQQVITVQHKQTLSTTLGFAAGNLELPGLGGMASEAQVRLRFGREWVPLFQSFAGSRHMALPDLVDVVLLVFLALWAERLLRALGLARPRRVLLAVLVAAMAGASEAYWLVLFTLSAGTIFWGLCWLRDLRLNSLLPSYSSVVGVATTVGLGALLVVGVSTLFGDNVRRLFGMSADALGGDSAVIGGGHAPVAAEPMATPAPQGVYQGLPARLDIPAGVRRDQLSSEIVDTSAQGSVRVLLISTWLVNALRALLGLAVLVLAYLSRAQVLSGVRVQLAKLVSAQVPSEPREA
jgi:hypothetical protein